MEKCKNCIHKFVCSILESKGYQQECEWFVDRAKFMELPTYLKKGDRVYFIYEEKGKFKVSNPSIVSAVMKEGFFTFGNIYCTKEDEFDAYRDDFNYYSEIGEICFYTKKEAQKAVDKKNKKEKR